VQASTSSSRAITSAGPARAEATATRRAPGTSWALRAWTTPIPPRPATPRRITFPRSPAPVRSAPRCLTTRAGVCQPQQSLAQSIDEAATGNRRAATLADVAAHAGVSASTASRALNGRGELSEATRAAVLEAAQTLGFEASPLARSLRTRTTYTVGFVVPDVSSPFYAAALKGAALCGPPCRGEFSKERNREAEGLGRRLTCESRLRGFAAPEKPAREVVSRRTAWRLLNRCESGSREDGAGSGLLNVTRTAQAG